MADLVSVLIVLAFFGLCVLYIRGCDRIIRKDEIGEPTVELTSRGSRTTVNNVDNIAGLLLAVALTAFLFVCAAVSGEVLMSIPSWLQFAVLIAVLLLTAPPLGFYMAKVYGDEGKAPGDRVFGPIERVDLQRYAGWILPASSAGQPTRSPCSRSVVVSFLLLYGIERLQAVLPFNPTDKPEVTDHVAFNAAVSFMTNTNWQSYSGEVTMSHLTQMTGLAVQNFVSAAVGMCVMAALIRGLARKRAGTLGNFWVDLTRTVIRIMLPLSFVVAIVLVSQGVIQNLHGFTSADTVEGVTQLIPGGPTASQVAIKQLGTNGGGFFNMNSSHPFENYSPMSNFVENWAILIIPFALAFTFGRMVRDRRQGSRCSLSWR